MLFLSPIRFPGDWGQPVLEPDPAPVVEPSVAPVEPVVLPVEPLVVSVPPVWVPSVAFAVDPSPAVSLDSPPVVSPCARQTPKSSQVAPASQHAAASAHHRTGSWDATHSRVHRNWPWAGTGDGTASATHTEPSAQFVLLSQGVTAALVFPELDSPPVDEVPLVSSGPGGGSDDFSPDSSRQPMSSKASSKLDVRDAFAAFTSPTHRRHQCSDR